MTRVVLAGLATVLLAGCGFSPAKILAPFSRIEVQELRRSQQCNTPDAEPRAELLADRAAVRAWQTARGIDLIGEADIPDAPYVVVEVGAQSTGGYGVAVSRPAVLRGDLLILYATFIAPAPGAVTAQVLTSPCALVRLPPGRYGRVEVHDQSDAIRAHGSTAAGGPSP